MKKNFKTYLGIDWGEKRIGLAIGSDETGLASPYEVVKDIDDIKKIIELEDVEHVVIGKPIKMSGEKDDLTAGFVQFVRDFKKAISLPVDLIDERLTSKAADSLALGKQKIKLTKKNRKTSAERDAVAAMLILQLYFDREL
jgi:putative Holliday junction resolvase